MSRRRARRSPGGLPGSALLSPQTPFAAHDVHHELRSREEQLRTLVANIPGVVYRCACDADWTIQYISPYVEVLTGFPPTDFVGNRVRTYGAMIHPEDRAYVRAGIDAALAQGSPYGLRYRILRADAEVRWIAEHGRAVLGRGGERLWLDGVIFDVTQRTLAEQARDRAEEELKRQAEINHHRSLHDPLTSLANRTLFDQRVRGELLAARRREQELAVLVLDLDRFKEINDTLGHACGDEFLREVGRRLLGSLERGTAIARLGGDEFAVALTGTDVDCVLTTAERLRRAIDRPCELDGLAVSVEASVGVARFPHDGDDVEVLLKRADAAMYVAKVSNAGVATYDADDDDSHEPTRLTLVGELRRAIDERELVLHYQPKVQLNDGRLSGVEALVRWQHPDRGLVMPDEFIPVAQMTGLMKPLTLYVIDEALRQCREWCETGLRVPVAVNVSPRSLIDVAFADDVAALLRRRAVAPELLELELTESAILADPVRAAAVLGRLGDMGLRLAMDDFGTGYSSLLHLTRLPIDAIKIDRSFVKEMSHSRNDAVIVRSTIDLGRNLGLEVVAEGVEDAATCARLEDLACDVAQGYFLSRPCPADVLTPVLAQLRSASGSPPWRARAAA